MTKNKIKNRIQSKNKNKKVLTKQIFYLIKFKKITMFQKR